MAAVAAGMVVGDALTCLFAGGHSGDASDAQEWDIGWDDFSLWFDGPVIQSDFGSVWSDTFGPMGDSCFLPLLVGFDHGVGNPVGPFVSKQSVAC